MTSIGRHGERAAAQAARSSYGPLEDCILGGPLPFPLRKVEHSEGRHMQLADRFKLISGKILLDSQEAGLGKDQPTKGQNREGVPREFLSEKLPFQYGVGSGEVIFRGGTLSTQTDIVIYDKLRCPILYLQESPLMPVDGTYGIVEVKSALS